jgi:hypothetical protein
MEQRSFYDNWWFWLFVFLTFSVLCVSLMWSTLGKAAIEKGEYKITIDVGDNYKNLVGDVKGIKCPDCNCKYPEGIYWPDYYEPFNLTPRNDSIWNGSWLGPDTAWVYVSAPNRR